MRVSSSITASGTRVRSPRKRVLTPTARAGDSLPRPIAAVDPAGVAQLFLEEVTKSIRNIRADVKRLAIDGVSVHQFRVLAHISKGVRTPGELAEHLGFNRPNMTRLVTCMMKSGFIKMSRNPHDRRSFFLKMTAKGERCHVEIKKQLTLRLTLKMSQLSERSRSQLFSGLQVIAEVNRTIAEVSDLPGGSS